VCAAQAREIRRYGAMRRRIAALLMVVGFMLATAAPAFADKPANKPYWLCSFEGVQFTATAPAAQEVNRLVGRGTCELVHPTHSH
jgi:hypothetical protein